MTALIEASLPWLVHFYIVMHINTITLINVCRRRSGYILLLSNTSRRSFVTVFYNIELHKRHDWNGTQGFWYFTILPLFSFCDELVVALKPRLLYDCSWIPIFAMLCYYFCCDVGSKFDMVLQTKYSPY